MSSRVQAPGVLQTTDFACAAAHLSTCKLASHAAPRGLWRKCSPGSRHGSCKAPAHAGPHLQMRAGRTASQPEQAACRGQGCLQVSQAILLFIWHRMLLHVSEPPECMQLPICVLAERLVEARAGCARRPRLLGRHPWSGRAPRSTGSTLAQDRAWHPGKMPPRR